MKQSTIDNGARKKPYLQRGAQMAGFNSRAARSGEPKNNVLHAGIPNVPSRLEAIRQTRMDDLAGKTVKGRIKITNQGVPRDRVAPKVGGRKNVFQ